MALITIPISGLVNIYTRPSRPFRCLASGTISPRSLAFALDRGEIWGMYIGDVAAFLRLINTQALAARLAVLCATLLVASPGATLAQSPSSGSPVGMRQLEYTDGGGRHLALTVFYPAEIRDRSAARFVMPFFANLNLYKVVDRQLLAIAGYLISAVTD